MRGELKHFTTKNLFNTKDNNVGQETKQNKTKQNSAQKTNSKNIPYYK